MNTTQALGELRRLGRPIVETREAMARLGLSASRTSKILHGLAENGLATKLQNGVWLLDQDADAYSLAPYLTAPYPSYISLYSALSEHGLIEQIPNAIHVVSLDRTRTIDTPRGRYSIHHMTADVFGGYNGTPETGYVATAEKALFDTVYNRLALNKGVYLPEIELPADFDQAAMAAWTDKIKAAWLKTLVAQNLERVLSTAQHAE